MLTLDFTPAGGVPRLLVREQGLQPGAARREAAASLSCVRGAAVHVQYSYSTRGVLGTRGTATERRRHSNFLHNYVKCNANICLVMTMRKLSADAVLNLILVVARDVFSINVGRSIIFITFLFCTFFECTLSLLVFVSF